MVSEICMKIQEQDLKETRTGIGRFARKSLASFSTNQNDYLCFGNADGSRLHICRQRFTVILVVRYTVGQFKNHRSLEKF